MRLFPPAVVLWGGGRGKLKLYEHFKFNYTFQWMKIHAKARTLQMEVLKTLPLQFLL